MKKPPTFVIHGCFFLLLTIILAVGWWLAGAGDVSAPSARARTLSAKGPQDAAFCGPLQQPLAPPPLDSPYGLHLYADTPARQIIALPAMEIARQLPAPAMGSNTKSEIADSTETPKNETAFDDVQSVNALLEEYRRAFGAMPVGELNDEIVRRLQGENPKGIAVLPKTHPAINAEGELLDRWGTPYRFHPESAWHMTVRSAGPDQKMWTSDDILTENGLMTSQL